VCLLAFLPGAAFFASGKKQPNVEDPPSFGGVNQGEVPIMSIENTTLAHFRHFSSLFTLSILYICREPSTNQLIFMQNKPNLLDAQMNVSILSRMAYKNETASGSGKNKPNSNPIKPNFRRARMNVNSFITKDYRKKDDFAVRKNKPNSNPIQTQSKPILKGMNVTFCATGYYESKPTFAVRKGRPNNPNVEITTAWSCGARIVTPEG